MRNPLVSVISRPVAASGLWRVGFTAILVLCGLVLCGLSTVASGQESIAKLRSALKSPDEKARIQAIDALGRMGPSAKEAVKDLAGQLADKSPAVRAHAAFALRAIGPGAAEAVDALVKLVGDPDEHVRRVAVEALERIHPDPQVAVPALAKALEDASPPVRVAALAALTEYGPAAIGALAHALENKQTRYWAALALGQLGPVAKPAVAALTAALADERPDVQREIIIALAHIGPDAAVAAPTIAPYLSNPDPGVRNSAAYALGRMGPAATAATAALREAMKSPDELLQAVSAWALARIEPMNKAAREEAITLLSAALKNKNPRVRAAALRALLELETPPATLVPLLAGVMAEADDEFVHEVMDAFAQWGEAATPALIEALKRPGARTRVALLLARLGSKSNVAIPALVAALDDKDPLVRKEVLFALSAMGPAAAPAAGAIQKLLDDPDSHVRAIAAYALGRMGEKARAAVPQLKKELESSDPVLRVACAWALVHILGPDKQIAAQVLPVLLKGLQSQIVSVRRGSAEALGQLGPLARSASAALQTAAKDLDESVAKAATTALERVGGSTTTPPRPKAPARR